MQKPPVAFLTTVLVVLSKRKKQQAFGSIN